VEYIKKHFKNADKLMSLTVRLKLQNEVKLHVNTEIIGEF